MMINATHYVRWLAAVLMLLPGMALAQMAGQVVSVVGEASVIRAQTKERLAISPRMEIAIGDTVSTARDGVVKLLLKDESVLAVGVNTEMVITQALVGVDGESQTSIKMMKGWLRSMVGKKLGSRSSYQISTPVAVAGVRGTDFEVLVEGFVTAVRCRDGLVAVSNINPDVIGTIEVEPNTFTIVRLNLPPEALQSIAPGDSLRLRILGPSGSSGDTGMETGLVDPLTDIRLELSEIAYMARVVSVEEIVPGVGLGSGKLGELPAFSLVIEIEEVIDDEEEIIEVEVSDPEGMSIPIDVTVPELKY